MCFSGIPKFIKLLREDKKIQIEGDGTQIRGFLHVDDACEAFDLILTKGKIGEIYNIGSEEEYTILEIADKIVSLLAKSKESIEFVEDRKGHDFRYSIDCEKLKKGLGWKIETSFMEGIRKTIDWYMKNNEWWKEMSSDIFRSTPWKN